MMRCLRSNPSKALREARSLGHQRGIAESPKTARKARAELVGDAEAPSHGVKAKTLLARSKTATLASLLHDDGKTPYASLVNVAVDPVTGFPMTVISRMAEHHGNVSSNSKVSLLVTTPAPDQLDGLAVSRATFVGKMKKVDKTNARKEAFRKIHSDALYVEFNDFEIWILEAERVRYIGGFGDMSWVGQEELAESSIDEIASSPLQEKWVKHMNEDHASAVLTLARTLGKQEDVADAKLRLIDRLGLEIDVEHSKGPPSLIRLAFSEPLTSANENEIRAAVKKLMEKAN